jgi:Xaa-Pro aminopeptidase
MGSVCATSIRWCCICATSRQTATTGVVQENMVFSVESYAADAHRGEGVKLEEQILVTATGPVRLSSARFEEGML